MKRSRLRRMIYDSLRQEMPELVLCDDLICVTPLNSMLRGVIVTILTKSPQIAHVSTFARPLFCPTPGLIGAFSSVTRGLWRYDSWNLDEVEDPKTFNRLLRSTRRKVQKLSLVDTPEKYAKNWVWVFGRRITGWNWLWVGLSYAHAGQYKKASSILRRKVLTWRPKHQVHAMLANYANPVIEAIEAVDHGRVREQLAQWEEMAIGEFRSEGVNLNVLY